jgi:hypothetical protein
VQKQVAGILQNPARALQAGGTAGALASTTGEAGTGLANAAGEGLAPEGAPAEVAQTIHLKRELINRIKTDPEAASRLVQNWIRQSEAK